MHGGGAEGLSGQKVGGQADGATCIVDIFCGFF